MFLDSLYVLDQHKIADNSKGKRENNLLFHFFFLGKKSEKWSVHLALALPNQY